MEPFISEDFLLTNDIAREIFHESAEQQPIIDYHCHLNPKEIAENKPFQNIADMWLGGDHYKWRLMRGCGADESLITGNAPPEEKFKAFAEALSLSPGNPIHHWSHLELARYFSFYEPLSPQNAETCFKWCNERLKSMPMTPRSIIETSKVKVICTTDDPDDSLEYHKAIAESGFPAKVLPTFRPDRLLKNPEGRSKSELLSHLEKRLDYFKNQGCVLADHGLANFEGNNEVLFELAKMYRQRDMVMQLHFGVLRNVSPKAMAALGPDSGYDIMGDYPCAEKLSEILGGLEAENALPKTILYSINSNDNPILSCLAAAFAPRVRHGMAWWFNDSKYGMEQQLQIMASMSPLGHFLGMLTDSRSFLSYTRHEYFRRILCNYLGGLAEKGEFQRDMPLLKTMAANISYKNVNSFIFQ